MLRNARSSPPRAPLISSAEGVPDDVEMAPTSAEPSDSSRAKPSAEIVEETQKERLLAILLAIALVVPGIAFAVAIIDQWASSPSQRGWLILGFGFYILAALKALWESILRLYDRIFYLRVELRRIVCPTLFEAVSNSIAEEAEKAGRTCSWDQEAVQEHDQLTGDFAVKMRFWSSQPRTIRMRLVEVEDCVEQSDTGTPRHATERPGRGHATERPGRLPRRELVAEVRYSPGEDVVTGRDSRVERREMLVLRVTTSAERVLEDKAMIRRWLKNCHDKWMEQAEGVVKVFALQESSSDWVPTWAFERVRQVKSSQSTGQEFYLERDSLKTILADAQLWSGSALRVYLVRGPPGVGKSEFIIWLAAQLKLPVYRLCLSSPKMTDDRLAQLLSQSAVTHNEVLVQVDEFQETVNRWKQSHESRVESSGVTPGGFCECLQGSTAMGRGVVVLTGTEEVAQEDVRRMLPAVFRRVHREAFLSWISKQDVCCYFRLFLSRFVPGCAHAEWVDWARIFTGEGTPWGCARPISVDMLKQFLMHTITEASCAGLGDFSGTGSGGVMEFQVHATRRTDFFALVCNSSRAEAFLQSYSPVH